MRVILPFLAALSLAACSSQVPESGANASYGASIGQATRAALAGSQPAGQAEGAAAAGATQTAQAAGTDPNYLNPDRPRGGDGFAGIKQVQSELEFNANGTPVAIPKENRAAISDEQNFNAVKDRVSIQQDAARLAQMRAEYKVIQPQPLPERPNSDGPNLASYALSTSNPIGHRIYKRFSLFGDAGYQRACARYSSPDKAQIAFLADGGPKNDPMGLDPDGDGYACTWNPAPFRAVKP
ncbi:MAG: hypothetical protein KGI94_05765 [Paracoccaceae bacterium]|nr:hypothetical protein [Paracoccaceae bacterium]